ncbi:hypothetical protein H6F74_26680 [Trichocoleus sp. FACHB-90]|nr:hypothetical protein [Trichocoleus sp. FACHB-90]MBD1929792.1 hypothetical protein [Trichocoleus sp. FACHB-90]
MRTRIDRCGLFFGLYPEVTEPYRIALTSGNFRCLTLNTPPARGCVEH